MTDLHEVLPVIVFALRYDDYGDAGWMSWERCVERWRTSWLPALEKEHSGDCTDDCWSCARCQAEDCIRVARMIEEGLRGD